MSMEYPTKNTFTNLSPETISEIEAIYAEATVKLLELSRKKDFLVKDYIKSLEKHKIQEIRRSLGLTD